MNEKLAAKASSTETTLSIHDKLQEEKMKCINAYSSCNENLRTKNTELTTSLKTLLKLQNQNGKDSDNKEYRSAFQAHIDLTKGFTAFIEMNKSMKSDYALAIIKIQELQTN